MLNKKIYEDLRNARDSNDYRCMGVQNLSRSDLDETELYAATIDSLGTYKGALICPSGNTANVLNKYGYLKKDDKFGR